MSSNSRPILGWTTTQKPKNSSSTTRTTEVDASTSGGNIPQTRVDIPVTGVIGQKRVPNANVIWTGNLKPITKTTTENVQETEVVDMGGGTTETTTTTKTVTTTTIIGYTADIHMGICLGPNVKLIAIYNDNAKVWEGTAGPDSTSFTFPKNATWLSEVQAVFSGGAYDQTPDPYVAALVPDYPGYVGVATILLKQVRVDLPMGNISFEVVKVPNPLGLTTTINQKVNDVNIVSSLVHVMSEGWGFGGVSLSDIDVATFATMATTLKDEGNFSSGKFDSEVSLASIIGDMSDQADLIIFQNPQTGKITGKLFRPDSINQATLTSFHTGNVEDMQNFQKSYWPSTVEQLRGLYTERDADYNDVPVFIQNGSTIGQSRRGKRGASVYYPYVASKDLAIDLVARDLAAVTTPMFGFTIVTNRAGGSKLPGDVVSVTWPKFNLLNVPCLVVKVRKHDILTEKTSLMVKLATRPTLIGIFGTAEGIETEFSMEPVKPPSALILTAPYFLVRRRTGTQISQQASQVFPLFLPTPANNTQTGFNTWLTNGPGSDVNPIKYLEGSLYPTKAILAADMLLWDGANTGILPSATITNVVNGVNLRSVGNSGVRQGQIFLIIGNEILSFEGVTDNGDGSYTLTNVHRALLDTVAEGHSAGNTVYIIGGDTSVIAPAGFTYPIGYTPEWQIASNTHLKFGTVDDALETSGWNPSFARTLAPPRPHNVRIDAAARTGAAINLAQGAAINVTWAIRSRGNLNVALQADASDPPEVYGLRNQTHKVYLVDHANTIHTLGTAASGASALAGTVPSAAALGTGYLYVEANFDTRVSMQNELYPVNITV